MGFEWPAEKSTRLKAETSYEWVKVGKYWTQVLSIGSAKPTQISLESGQNIFLMIPGVPGIAELYEGFGVSLLKQTSNNAFSFWCISHVNHVNLPANLKSSEHQGTEYVEMWEQTEQCVRFFKQIVPKNAKVYVFAHSSGCYELLHALRQLDEFSHVVQKICFIQPVIEQASLTDNGKTYNILRRWKLDVATLGLVRLLRVLPAWATDLAMQYVWVGRGAVDPRVAKCAREHIAWPPVYWNCHLYGRGVAERLDEALVVGNHFSANMRFFYGTWDGWCNADFGLSMARRLPGQVHFIKHDDISHGFYCHQSEWRRLAHTLLRHLHHL